MSLILKRLKNTAKRLTFVIVLFELFNILQQHYNIKLHY